MRERFRQVLAVGSVVATTGVSLTIVATAQAAPLPAGREAVTTGTGNGGAPGPAAITSRAAVGPLTTPSGVPALAPEPLAWSAPVNTNMGLVSV
ncbi:MAG TPA: hypothetical protein VK425_10475, partial [Acidimicrobiales bacterium]|nr:hypothetical protein [Acidimicrobiales bacterium]